jgi:hypothetical protein
MRLSGEPPARVLEAIVDTRLGVCPGFFFDMCGCSERRIAGLEEEVGEGEIAELIWVIAGLWEDEFEFIP